MKIGLIGLGIMGKPMAKNLLKAGYDLTVSDLNQASVDEIVAAGAKAATNAEIGETCDADRSDPLCAGLGQSPVHLRKICAGPEQVGDDRKGGG